MTLLWSGNELDIANDETLTFEVYLDQRRSITAMRATPVANVDPDLIMVIQRHLQADEQMLDLMSELLTMLPKEKRQKSMKQVADETRVFWGNVVRDQRGPIDPNRSPLEMLQGQVSAVDNPAAAHVVQALSTFAQTEQLQADELQEMRGRLSERYPGFEFRLPQ